MGDVETHPDADGPFPPRRLEDEFVFGFLASDEAITALDEWRQGDLVTGVRLMWAVPASGDALFGDETRVTTRQGWDGVVCDIPLIDEDPERSSRVLDYGIITSQTCDIGAIGPGRIHPTVQVSPLLRLDQLGADQAASVLKGKTKYLVHATGVPEPGEWAADLRISIPVSKGVLCQQSRVHGFAEERQTLDFANRVAIRYARPAVHDAVDGELVPSLRSLVKSADAAGQSWTNKVEQFRLRITGGTRLEPSELELMAILDEDLTAQERQPLREWLELQRPSLKAACGAALSPMRFLTLEQVLVRDYRDAVPLAVPELGRPPYM